MCCRRGRRGKALEVGLMTGRGDCHSQAEEGSSDSLGGFSGSQVLMGLDSSSGLSVSWKPL